MSSSSAQNLNSKGPASYESGPIKLPRPADCMRDMHGGESHLPEVHTQMRDIKLRVVEALRHRPLVKAIAIDDQSTKLREDAFSLRENAEGTAYILDISVPDVSAFVAPDSAIYNEALRCVQSVRGRRLFPAELSHQVFGFRKLAPSPAITVSITIKKESSVIQSVQIQRTTLQLSQRLDWEMANDLIMNECDDPEEQKVAEQLRACLHLAENLLQNRIANGALEYFDPHSGLYIHPHNGIRNIRQEEASEFIVREFMLLLKQSIGTYALQHKIPMIFLDRPLKAGEKSPSIRDVRAVESDEIERTLARLQRRYEGQSAHVRGSSSCSMKHIGIGAFAAFSSPLRNLADAINQFSLMQEPGSKPLYDPGAMRQLAEYIDYMSKGALAKCA